MFIVNVIVDTRSSDRNISIEHVCKMESEDDELNTKPKIHVWREMTFRKFEKQLKLRIH